MLVNFFIGLLNLSLVLLLSPLFEGVMRKLKAIVHSRIGPPVTQPYIDLLKLLGKEEIRTSRGVIFQMAPIICFASVLMLALLAPLGSAPPLDFAGDFIAFLYFASLSAVAVMMGAFASINTYAYVGATREMMMMLTVEPVLAVALIAAAIKAHTLSLGSMSTWYLSSGASLSMVLAGIAFFLALQAQLCKLPFDIAEADQEIMEGPFIEQSGPRLALFKFSFYAKQLIFSSVLLQVFVPWVRVGTILGLGFPLRGLVNVAANLVGVLILLVIVGVIDVVNPRLRIDQSMAYFGRVVFVSLAAVAFAIMGA